MARQLREGGVKASPSRNKELFKTFIHFVAFKNKNYFTFDNLSKYGHITVKFVGIFTGYFPKK